MNRGHRPLVGVTADFRSLPDHPHQAHLAGETYLRAVSEGAGAYPVVLPALSADFDVLDVLGLVEAVSAENTRGFALAVQWHPEWDFGSNPVSAAIFRAFGNACRSYRGSA